MTLGIIFFVLEHGPRYQGPRIMTPEQRTTLTTDIARLIEKTLGNGAKLVNYAPIEELVDQYRPKMSDFYVSGHIPLVDGSGREFRARGSLMPFRNLSSGPTSRIRSSNVRKSSRHSVKPSQLIVWSRR